jgi:adenosylhomocysteine nucleosidase
MIGVIGAMGVEVDLLLDEMELSAVVERVGLTYSVGSLRGCEVVVVVGGVGTVNAAAATAMLIDEFDPVAVLCTGVAGGLPPAITGDIVIGSAVISLGHGDLSADGFTPTPTECARPDGPNPLLFAADPGLLAAARSVGGTLALAPLNCMADKRVPRFRTGVIATEDAYSIDGARNQHMLESYGCIAFEMEGAAIAQICHQSNVPFLCVRGISNPADEAGAALGVYQRCKHETARSSQVVILDLLARLATD